MPKHLIGCSFGMPGQKGDFLKFLDWNFVIGELIPSRWSD
jgi:hypothetical protein